MKEQLESALHDAEAALAGLRPEADGPPAPAEQVAQSAAATAAPPASPTPQPAAAQPRRAAPGSSNARIHPRSKWAYEEPDFAALARLYPSLEPFLLRPGSGNGGDSSEAAGPAAAEGAAADGAAEGGVAAAAAAPSRASLDFTSPAACRELTRVLLRHDLGLEW